MKKIILRYDRRINPENFSELFQAALNYGIFDIYSDEIYADKISVLERIYLYSESLYDNPQYLVLNEPTEEQLKNSLNEALRSNYLVGCKFNLSSKDDEKKIINIAKTNGDLSFIIVHTTDWKVIPFENLIAELSSEDILLYAEIDTIEDAKLLLKTLEKGVDGIVFTPSDPNQIFELKAIAGGTLRIPLTSAEILEIKDIPKADRVCVDTTSILHKGEGMLIGSTAKGFAVVHAEVFETEFVNSRPFRVNAGDVSSYILVPSFDESGELKTHTNYLSELKAGDDVIVTDTNGNLRIVTVGRVKIETRPMLLFKLIAKIPEEKFEIPINLIVQNAETIRLVKENGTPVPVVNLKRGDKIMVHLGPGATHFGTAIKETIIEK